MRDEDACIYVYPSCYHQTSEEGQLQIEEGELGRRKTEGSGQPRELSRGQRGGAAPRKSSRGGAQRARGPRGRSASG
ncbi:hypothetical protein CRG98_044148 [Punica granatum]|uniref:Uncharacterized protein n=1 Tax=Punica granatum TaxID=22663 RepID=A0A2I0HUT4_PUNGR|nr:hypothetical protein CRG98_044148 [Punica granatum]